MIHLPTGHLRALALGAALVLGISTPALAQKIDSALDDAVRRALPYQALPVIVQLEDGADVRAIASSARRASRRDRSALVLRALRRAARDGQDRLDPEIARLERRGAVRQVRRHWIFSGYTMRATPKAIAALAARPEVRSVELDRVVQLPRTDQAPAIAAEGDSEWGVERIDAPLVWQVFGARGEGVVVGVLDTGVAASHPDLANFTGQWLDAVAGKPLAYDDHGHGTHVAGTAVGGNTSGTAIGVAPGASWMACKAFDNRGSGSTSRILSCMEWMADPDGNPETDDQPDIVNNSWSSDTGQCRSAYMTAVVSWWAAGILPVFAANNDGPGVGSGSSPANYALSFAVGSTDVNDVIAGSSGRGPSACDGAVFPDVSAPGVSIHSAHPNGGYSYRSGTSMATPHVAGCAALLRSAAPLDGQGGVPQNLWDFALLRNVTLDLGDAGADDTYGTGRLQCFHSVYVAEVLERIFEAQSQALR